VIYVEQVLHRQTSGILAPGVFSATLYSKAVSGQQAQVM
jgi:hypothetical protein